MNNPSTPVWRPGVEVRTTRRTYWCWRDQKIDVPAGTRGVAELDAARRLVIRFDGIEHPEFGAFPKYLSLAKPITDAFTLENF